MAKYTIEIVGPNNESVKFNPTRERIRGRWDSRAHAGRRLLPLQAELFSKVPVIPGKLVELDTDAMTGRVIDPLTETASGRKILDKINEVFSSHQFETGGLKHGDETRTDELSVDGVKEWAFHMRNLLDSNLAQLVPGSVDLPSARLILSTWAGKIRRDPLSDRIEFDPVKAPEFIHEVADKKAVKA